MQVNFDKPTVDQISDILINNIFKLTAFEVFILVSVILIFVLGITYLVKQFLCTSEKSKQSYNFSADELIFRASQLLSQISKDSNTLNTNTVQNCIVSMENVVNGLVEANERLMDRLTANGKYYTSLMKDIMTNKDSKLPN